MPGLKTFPLLPSTCLTYHFPCREFKNSQCTTRRPVRSHYQCLTEGLLKYGQNDKVIELWAHKVILISIFSLKYMNIKYGWTVWKIFVSCSLSQDREGLFRHLYPRVVKSVWIISTDDKAAG